MTSRLQCTGHDKGSRYCNEKVCHIILIKQLTMNACAVKHSFCNFCTYISLVHPNDGKNFYPPMVIHLELMYCRPHAMTASPKVG
jgi:hypothetical protein